MGVVQSIIDTALAMSWLEIVAVFFGISSVIYSKKENILVYPTGVISVLIYVYLCFGIKLYADMSINVFYFVMSIYGWINWSKKNLKIELKISWNSKRENIYSVALIIALWMVLYLLLSKFTDSDVPYIDSFTTAVCFVGMWLMAWKRVENWIMWIVADVVSIPLYWHKGFYLTSVQFVFFTVLAILGYLEWKKKLS